MERLTIDEIIQHCERTVKRFERYFTVNNSEKIKRDKEYLEHKQVKEYLEEFKRYKELENQGKLIKVPCVPGDILYTNVRMQGWYMRRGKAPYKVTIVFVGINGKEDFFNVVYENGNMFQFRFSDIGKFIFVTEQEAKEALEE